MPSTVWYGNDADLLKWVIPFYCGTNPVVLDATYGRGTMWKGTDGPTVGIDLNPSKGVMVMSNEDMGFIDAVFDVVVYDPPHMVDAGTSNTFYLYGDATHVSYQFFLEEAKRVLRPNGVVLAKIADQVHSNEQQWNHLTFMNAALELDLTIDDLIVKVRKNAMVDPKWKNISHARKHHSFFIIVRK